MFKIYVGLEKKCWMIHEAVICNISTFFRNAFQRNFAEGTTKEITLEEDDLEVSKTLVDWLYSLGSGDCYQRPDLEPWKHCMIYYGFDIFADKVGSKKLSEYTWECYLECVEKCDHVQYQDHVEEIEIVFEKSPTDSPFQKSSHRS